MRSQLPAVVVTLLCLVLGYRVVTLNRRVEELERGLAQLEAAAAKPDADAAAGDGAATAPAHGTVGTVPKSGTRDGNRNGDAELASLGAELERLREELRTLEAATADRATLEDIDTAIGEERILDVVQRKHAVVRDKQLAFQRDRWLGWRRQALEGFAEQVHLEPQQQQALLQHLEAEVDGIVALMRAPGADEDPWAAAAQWRELLDETDRKAQEVLEPSQLPAWTQARETERRVLWPWLAKK